MIEQRTPKIGDLAKAISASLDNGFRLLEETDDLEFRTPSATRYFMAMIAQEEFAKAFLLYLIKERIAPFNTGVRRALNDHRCKQLTGMIMDYMIMHWEDIDDLKAAIELDVEHGDRLPNDVGSALEILCYEKIETWTGRTWVWAEDPGYNAVAQKVADGAKDRRKQDALYVRTGGMGQVASTPATITDSETEAELSRAGRYGHFVRSLEDVDNPEGRFEKSRFDRILTALSALFRTTS